MGAVSWLLCPLLRVRTDLSLYLDWSENSTPSKQIEGHLSEKTIDTVFDNSGKPGAEGIGMKVA